MRTVMRPIVLSLVLLAGCLTQAAAQEGAFAFQIQGGWGAPLGEFRSGEGTWQGGSGQGPNFSMGFTFPAPGPLGAYLGFGQRLFNCDDSVCPGGKDWTSTGFDVALRWVLGEGRLRGWLQGGLHTHRIEGRILDSSGQPSSVTSQGGGGVEVLAGALVSIGERTSLSPAVRYGWGAVPFAERASMELQYLVLEVGILMGF